MGPFLHVHWGAHSLVLKGKVEVHSSIQYEWPSGHMSEGFLKSRFFN